MYGIAAGSFYSETGPLWPTLYAIHDALRREIFFDVSPEACSEAAAEFATFSRGEMNQCVCAVDGLVIRTRQVRTTSFEEALSITTCTPSSNANVSFFLHNRRKKN